MRVHQADRGTVLLLFPAAVLIMFLLGAIVLDVGLTQLRGHELEAAAGSAANDALAALDVGALRSGAGIVIDENQARAAVESAVAAGSLPAAQVERVEVGVDTLGRIVVAVTLSLDVEMVMAPSIGDLAEVTLRRTATATILGSELA